MQIVPSPAAHCKTSVVTNFVKVYLAMTEGTVFRHHFSNIVLVLGHRLVRRKLRSRSISKDRDALSQVKRLVYAAAPSLQIRRETDIKRVIRNRVE
jgi:hypothetical protein